MNKKEFLDALAKKLSVLEEDEKEDIISEYTDTINEKVKNGETEKEAVKDFGNLDDLVKEILKAYKINPNYNDKKESFGKKSEAVIKEGAGIIADFSKKIANRFTSVNNISLALVIEIVIKVFITLLTAMVLAWVLDVFTNIGEDIFSHTFSPFAEVLSLFWMIFLFVIYILLIVMLISSMFKGYFTKEDSKVKNSKIKNDKIKEEVKKINNSPKKKNNGTTISDILLFIIKIFVIIWVIIPIIFIDIFGIIGLVISVVYLLQGLDLAGLVIMMVGITGLITYIIVILFNLVINKGKISIIPPIISIIIIIIGGILFTNAIMSIKYYDEVPNKIETVVKTKNMELDKVTSIHYVDFAFKEDVELLTDNSMKDGEVKLDIEYYKDFNHINITKETITEDCEYREDECVPGTEDYIYIDNDIDDFVATKNGYDIFINNLKHKKVYNYEKLYKGKLTITANEKTEKLIKMEM